MRGWTNHNRITILEHNIQDYFWMMELTESLIKNMFEVNGKTKIEYDSKLIEFKALTKNINA